MQGVGTLYEEIRNLVYKEVTQLARTMVQKPEAAVSNLHSLSEATCPNKSMTYLVRVVCRKLFHEKTTIVRCLTEDDLFWVDRSVYI